MLESITLKFTEGPKSLFIPSQGVTIFVGPNNSGKSLVLRELESDISSHAAVEKLLLQEFSIIWPTLDQVQNDIKSLEKTRPSGLSPDHVYVGRFSPQGSLDAHAIHRGHLKNCFETKTEVRWIASQFLKYFLVRLDGRTRFALTDDRMRGDLLQPAQNFLAHLFKDNVLRKKISDIVHDAVGLYFVIDALSGNHLRIRLSNAPPTADEQNFNEAARGYHSKAVHIKDASDGVQAFVGILCAVLSGDFRTILVDEPEAFLHPPLARKLGYELTHNLRSGGALMASTHSADFLIGCLQASSDVRVVRLQYANGKSKGNIVDSGVISSFYKSPLFRSANVISALFHDGVVVTESDNDRVFYSEIYHRLAEKEKGYPSILFINAQNKQTIRDIIGPLRAFGIPAAAIVDIDVLKDGGQVWSGWLNAAQIPTALHPGFSVQRGDLEKLYKDSNLNMKAVGVFGLQSADRDAANQMFDTLSDYGIFVVRGGELESWLKHLSVPGKGTDWTIAMLEKMGSDPRKSEYLQPSHDDVWDFIRTIITWVRNPSRKGTI